MINENPEFGKVENEYTSPPAKSRVKITKTKSSVNWEISVVQGEVMDMEMLKNEAIRIHNDLNREFPEAKPIEKPIKLIKPVTEVPNEVKEDPNKTTNKITGSPWIRPVDKPIL